MGDSDLESRSPLQIGGRMRFLKNSFEWVKAGGPGFPLRFECNAAYTSAPANSTTGAVAFRECSFAHRSRCPRRALGTQPWSSIRTRPPRKVTPSMLSRRRCSWPSSPIRAIRPPAATTRCQGRPAPPYNALTVRRAAPGNPAASATWPYVITFPRGTLAITRRNRASVDKPQAPVGHRSGRLWLLHRPE